ncbi:MAG: hypothetical protein GYB33_04850 [Gammaproteobacteria bacterium]|uniref:hypothetical protein n=1 Tax=Pseudomaricurvus alcaniphilus TaxID=1166482 RepID=UPI00140A670E|nr:hypothetical protein [Pseudomaricurvus alcaniphilus]MBR9909668.1 hypothetical protein [Gammaproteobacteria bacterium]NHN36916.1 hypothetical protein [Pseudomaricurvus alcaniphilus]
MITTMQKVGAGLVLIPSLLIAGLTPAEAGDRKVYPGSMGVKYSGPNPVYAWSAIGNPSSSSWMYVDLPVINDDTTSGIDYTRVDVLDRHYSSNVRCSINTAYWNNTYDTMYGYWGPNKYSTGSSNNAQYLYTGSASHGSTRHEYFSCAIPPTYSGNRSYIVSYTVSE